MTDTRIPSTAFADAWINIDNTEDPEFFVQALDSTRAELLERQNLPGRVLRAASHSPPGIAFPMSDAEPGTVLLSLGVLFDPRIAIGMKIVAIADSLQSDMITCSCR